MRFLILTDLEGVSGTDSFSQTRTDDTGPRGKGPSMKQLAKETNACAAGIHDILPAAEIDVIDGHGPGGLFPEDLQGCTCLPREASRERLRSEQMRMYAALLFVGQHAMAGMVDAPLCHTFSSKSIMYYRLNNVFIGEFGIYALVAGLRGVPTIFLSGDDKAVSEAKMFVPKIETVITKYGTGLERADHVEAELVCQMIRETTAAAVRRMDEIPPYTRFQPPYELERRYYEPLTEEYKKSHPDDEIIDNRTVRRVADNLDDVLS